jgi:hypothetical protein
LKKEGKFYVQKKTIAMYYQFTASTKPDDQERISELSGKSGGICDLVKTSDENNQGCGLAKYLMATCFQDNSILGDDERGVDISKDGNWADESKIRKDAISYCETITYLRCLPFGDPKPPSRVCISYLRAGSLANFNILFSLKRTYRTKGSLSFNVFMLGDPLEAKFNSDADKFIGDYGYTWYFCKCKEDMKEKCMGMAENNP